MDLKVANTMKFQGVFEIVLFLRPRDELLTYSLLTSPPPRTPNLSPTHMPVLDREEVSRIEE